MFTIEEAAERYGIDIDRLTTAVDAAEVASVTMTWNDGTDLTFLPTWDGAVAEWLEARA